ncbi:hypothetical protein F66182_1606 [Fusarium sp. NRRL 66182]|nr:hypothetical protein F66182_1606 [Fusarium sp. NRRL 66182]
MSLKSLANETWIQILEFLRLDCLDHSSLLQPPQSDTDFIDVQRMGLDADAYANLARVARTSKLFQTFAEPILYRTLLLTEFEDPGRIHRMVEALIHSPYRRDLVKVLFLCPRADSELSRDWALSFGAAFSSLGLPSPIPQGIAINFSIQRDCYEDAINAFCLALTPKLRRLYIRVSQCQFLVPAVLQSSLENNQSRFHALKELWLLPEPPMGLYATLTWVQNFDYIFGLPSLTSLHAIRFGWCGFQWMIRPTNHSITRIHLEGADVSLVELESLFLQCRGLRDLYLDIMIDDDASLSGQSSFSCDELGNIFRSCTNLESLMLSFRPTSKSDNDKIAGKLSSRIGNLQDLKSLRSLSMKLHVFSGFADTKISDLPPNYEPIQKSDRGPLRLTEILPDSLERLLLQPQRIGLDEDDMFLEVRDVLTCKRLSHICCVQVPPNMKRPKAERISGWEFSQETLSYTRLKSET